MTIRRFGKKLLSTEDLLKNETLTTGMLDFLSGCVEARLNVVISGGSGSGKTTMLNTLSRFIPEEERIVTIEDTAELQLQQEHVVRLETRPMNIEGAGAIGQRDLVINALRMRPDRIVIGECRGPEALDMLQAMNTGHDGSMTTIHANSGRDAFSRLETMVMMASQHIPDKVIRQMLASAVNIVIHTARLIDGTQKGDLDQRGDGGPRRPGRDAGHLRVRAQRHQRARPRHGPLPRHRRQAGLDGSAEGLRHSSFAVHLPGDARAQRTLTPMFLFAAFLIFTAALLAAGYYVYQVPHQQATQALTARMRELRARTNPRTRAAPDLLRREKRGSLAFLGDFVSWIGLLRRLQQYIEQANLAYRAADVFGLCLVIAGAVYLVSGLFGLSMIVLRVLLALGIGALPVFYISHKRAARLKKFEQSLPDAIDLFNRSMKAGHNIHAGLETVAQETFDPVKMEFNKVIEELALGSQLETALHGLGRRVPLIDLKFFITGLILQRQTGANMVSVLENLAAFRIAPENTVALTGVVAPVAPALRPETCNHSGTVSASPPAPAKNCGDDGCGGRCGTCAAGRVCQNGTCVLECASGQTVCADTCVDLESDPSHCGDCATICSSPTPKPAARAATARWERALLGGPTVTATPRTAARPTC